MAGRPLKSNRNDKKVYFNVETLKGKDVANGMEIFHMEGKKLIPGLGETYDPSIFNVSMKNRNGNRI
jgi:hypothetical protein